MRLARGLRPPTLTTSGLRGAFAELAARGPVPVDLTVPEPAPEVAAYFICSEALTNIAKHANASSVQIQIADTEADQRIKVADDGVGGADPATGSGLRGLQDRAEALGGSVAISSPRGQGTRLAADIPLGTRPGRVRPASSTSPPETIGGTAPSVR